VTERATLVRLLTAEDDLESELDLSHRAFGSFGAGERDRRLAAAGGSVGARRHIGAFDGGEMIGSAHWLDMRQWWHGRSLPMAGVAGVKVAPEHQGHGVGRRLMTGLLAEVAAQGYALSALYPATAALYHSIGWELAGGQYDVTIPARSLFSLQVADPLLDAASTAGRSGAVGGRARVQRAGPADAAQIIAIQSELHAANRGCGPLTYDAATLAHLLDNPDLYCYLAPDGVLIYQWNRSADEMLAYVVAAGSAATARQLWSVLASHGTMVASVRAFVNPADPVTWLVREPDVALSRHAMWMLRLIDAPAAIAGRGFPASAEVRVPVHIADAQLSANSGTWLLEIAGGKAALTRYEAGPGSADAGGAGGPADVGGPLQLSARGLAAMYAGTPLASLRVAGLASGGNADADAALDDAFCGPAYMFEYF
jgi:predicted N-acetyltransferase YhbS